MEVVAADGQGAEAGPVPAWGVVADAPVGVECHIPWVECPVRVAEAEAGWLVQEVAVGCHVLRLKWRDHRCRVGHKTWGAWEATLWLIGHQV